jgi:type IV pilus assembly protein PilA
MIFSQISRKDQNESGFTLIELLVVILIIGILAAIAIPAFLNQRSAATEASVKADVKNAGTLLGGQKKFTGSLAPGTKASPGVVLTAMRKSDRNNQVASSQFADGTDPEWQTFTANGASATTQLVTNAADGYKGMNYRRVTTTSSTGTSGQYVGFNLPEVAQNGDEYRVGAAMRHSYAGCRNINIEFKGANGGFPGGISTTNVCFQKDEWTYFEAPGKINGDNVNRVVMSLYAGNVPLGQTFDVTGAVIVKGTTIDSSAALDATGYDYCVQGYHESNPSNIWSYSNLDGGIRNQRC